MTARFACGDLAIVKSSGDIVAITQVHISEQDVHYSVLAGNKKRRFNGEWCGLQNRRRFAAGRAAVSFAGKHLPQ